MEESCSYLIVQIVDSHVIHYEDMYEIYYEHTIFIGDTNCNPRKRPGSILLDILSHF